MKTVKELVSVLHQNDLRTYCFGVYALDDGYIIALKGSRPEFQDRLYGFIGGERGYSTKAKIEARLNEMGIK